MIFFLILQYLVLTWACSPGKTVDANHPDAIDWDADIRPNTTLLLENSNDFNSSHEDKNWVLPGAFQRDGDSEIKSSESLSVEEIPEDESYATDEDCDDNQSFGSYWNQEILDTEPTLSLPIFQRAVLSYEQGLLLSSNPEDDAILYLGVPLCVVDRIFAFLPYQIASLICKRTYYMLRERLPFLQRDLIAKISDEKIDLYYEKEYDRDFYMSRVISSFMETGDIEEANNLARKLVKLPSEFEDERFYCILSGRGPFKYLPGVIRQFIAKFAWQKPFSNEIVPLSYFLARYHKGFEQYADSLRSICVKNIISAWYMIAWELECTPNFDIATERDHFLGLILDTCHGPYIDKIRILLQSNRIVPQACFSQMIVVYNEVEDLEHKEILFHVLQRSYNFSWANEYYRRAGLNFVPNIIGVVNLFLMLKKSSVKRLDVNHLQHLNFEFPALDMALQHLTCLDTVQDLNVDFLLNWPNDLDVDTEWLPLYRAVLMYSLSDELFSRYESLFEHFSDEDALKIALGIGFAKHLTLSKRVTLLQRAGYSYYAKLVSEISPGISRVQQLKKVYRGLDEQAKKKAIWFFPVGERRLLIKPVSFLNLAQRFVPDIIPISVYALRVILKVVGDNPKRARNYIGTIFSPLLYLFTPFDIVAQALLLDAYVYCVDGKYEAKFIKLGSNTSRQTIRRMTIRFQEAKKLHSHMSTIPGFVSTSSKLQHPELDVDEDEVSRFTFGDK
jgi:hypothetical protein